MKGGFFGGRRGKGTEIHTVDITGWLLNDVSVSNHDDGGNSKAIHMSPVPPFYKSRQKRSN